MNINLETVFLSPVFFFFFVNKLCLSCWLNSFDERNCSIRFDIWCWCWLRRDINYENESIHYLDEFHLLDPSQSSSSNFNEIRNREVIGDNFKEKTTNGNVDKMVTKRNQLYVDTSSTTQNGLTNTNGCNIKKVFDKIIKYLTWIYAHQQFL